MGHKSGYLGTDSLVSWIEGLLRSYPSVSKIDNMN